jgi:hypothetical protein
MVAVWFPVQIGCDTLGAPEVVAVLAGSAAAFGAYVATLRFGFRDAYNSLHEMATMLLNRRARRRPAVVSAD